MSCDHCVKAIVGAVGSLPGVVGVSVDLTSATVAVDHAPDLATVDAIKAEIEGQGYTVA
jgi:copper chaperone